MALFTTGGAVGIRSITGSAGIATTNVGLRGTLKNNTHGGSDSMSFYRSKTFRRFSIANTYYIEGNVQSRPVASITSPYSQSTSTASGSSFVTRMISHNNFTLTIQWSTPYSASDTWVFQGWYSSPLGVGTYLGGSVNLTLSSGSTDATYHAYSEGYEAGGFGPTCLIEGSLITMADGTTKAIENLQPGDEIKTIEVSGAPDGNTLTGPTDLYTWNDDTIYSTDSTTTIIENIEIEAPRVVNINNGLIRTTLSHIYLVEKELIDGTRTWSYRGAFNVEPGDKLISANGEDVLVTSVVREEESQNPAKAYSLTMLDNGTYIGNGIISHNGYKIA